MLKLKQEKKDSDPAGIHIHISIYIIHVNYPKGSLNNILPLNDISEHMDVELICVNWDKITQAN